MVEESSDVKLKLRIEKISDDEFRIEYDLLSTKEKVLAIPSKKILKIIAESFDLFKRNKNNETLIDLMKSNHKDLAQELKKHD